MAAPILDLDKLVDRPTVVIDGKEYWLLTPDILPPLDSHHFHHMWQRTSELMEKADLTDDEKAELGALPNRMCRLVLPEAPDAVHEALTDRKRMVVIGVASRTFFVRSPLTPQAGHATEAASPSTGANGSRA